MPSGSRNYPKNQEYFHINSQKQEAYFIYIMEVIVDGKINVINYTAISQIHY